MTPDPPYDAGQAIERTRLSWRRTVLSALAVTLLAVSKLVIAAPNRGALVVLVLMAVTWCGCLAVATRRMSALRHGNLAPVSRSPARLALLVTAYAALAAALTTLVH